MRTRTTLTIIIQRAIEPRRACDPRGPVGGAREDQTVGPGRATCHKLQPMDDAQLVHEDRRGAAPATRDLRAFASVLVLCRLVDHSDKLKL